MNRQADSLATLLSGRGCSPTTLPNPSPKVAVAFLSTIQRLGEELAYAKRSIRIEG